MRSEFNVDDRGALQLVVAGALTVGPPQPMTSQFVEDLGQSVANELFGYPTTGNENLATNVLEDCCAAGVGANTRDAHHDDLLRPKRKTRKLHDQVYIYLCVHMNKCFIL